MDLLNRHITHQAGVLHCNLKPYQIILNHIKFTEINLRYLSILHGNSLLNLYQIFIELYQMLYAFFLWCRLQFRTESVSDCTESLNLTVRTGQCAVSA